MSETSKSIWTIDIPSKEEDPFRKQRSLAMSFKNVDDTFSSLPEEILYHILSLMPTKYAVRTSVLSTSWRYRWTLVTNLDFHYNQIGKLLSIRLPRFPNMKHLRLRSYWTSGPVLQFLESSPELEHVYIEKLQESTWIEPKLVPACMLTNLKTIEFSISTWWKCDTPFLEYLVGNSEVLKTVTITSESSSNIDKEKQLFAKLLKFPRASGCCEIHLH